MRNFALSGGTLVLAGILSWAVSGRLRAQQSLAENQPSAEALPSEVDRGAAGLSHWLRALQTRASLLMVTAHPDDEDGGMLAYETRGAGARGVLLTLNRGEGGQNAMSPDLYDALGLVRTQELLAADRYYSVDQFWTRTVDYGFSKTREEALDKWSGERVLSDLVRVIRMTRPLVITSVFIGAPTDGHGNHQVAGEMAQEAFQAAGDPAQFPEQIREGLRPWSPLKVYARVPAFAVTPKGMYDYATDKYVPVRFYDYVSKTWSDQKPATNVRIPEGDFAPATGLTFLQIGRLGLGFQKSQNGGVGLPPPASLTSEYHRYGSRVPAAAQEAGFFDGIDVSLGGIAALAGQPPEFLRSGLMAITKLAAQAAESYAPEHPNRIAPALSDGLRETRSLLAEVRSSSLPEPAKSDVAFELKVKESQFQKALAAALGFSVYAAVDPERQPAPNRGYGSVEPTFQIAIPGQSFGVSVHVINEGQDPVDLKSVSLQALDGKGWRVQPPHDVAKNVAAHQTAHLDYKVAVPSGADLTRAYFSRPDEEQAYYNVNDERYRNLSLAPYPLRAAVEMDYHGVTVPVEAVVQTAQRIPGLGMELQPLLVGPPISVTVAPSAGVVPLNARSFAFSCTVHSNVKGPAQGILRLRLPTGWHSSPESAPYSMNHDGEDQTITFSVLPATVRPEPYQITAIAEYQGKTFEEGYRMAGYPGLRPYPYYRRSLYKTTGVDVNTASGLHLGYLPGTGDDVPRALENLGVSVRILASSDVTQGDLSQFDAIILGTRAYAVRPELKSANSRLLAYVQNGGVLLVQYNLQEFDRNYGPYPFTLGENPQKVVDEGSKVSLLDRGDPLFTWPNRITDADFSGWVEERGHGFLSSWDSRYKPLLETHDPGQDPQRGGLLLARYGNGAYIYDAFALYRQLSSGVPGAYRILANLVSLAKNPQFHK